MNGVGSIAWLALHETRLAWRDWITLITAGRRRRMSSVALVFIGFMIFLHGFAYLLLSAYGLPEGTADKRTLIALTGVLVLSWSLMLSQAMEAVTRTLYARGDLDLVLSAPFPSWRVFAVRMAAMTLTIVLMALVLAAPFIDVAIWRGGLRWLGGYGVVVALAMVAVSAAVALSVALFRSIGPKRTRSVAQIVAAVIGAAFVIGVQLAAVLSYGTVSRTAILQSEWLTELAPDGDSIVWWPARAALGDATALTVLLSLGAAALGVTIYVFAPRFERYALAASGVSFATRQRGGRLMDFAGRTPAQVLRRKEWILLWRDPWLISETLMQLLYLVPPAFLLWRNFGTGRDASVLVVPVLVMAAGQLGGALAWLAISGEDAPDLVASAPLSATRAQRAKTGAVMTAISLVFAPFLLALAVSAPFAALVAAMGIAVASVSATSIQIWFRAQAKRSHFRRRRTSSRIATYAEALSSTSWAVAGALTAAGTWLAVAPALIALAILGGTRMISPVAQPA